MVAYLIWYAWWLLSAGVLMVAISESMMWLVASYHQHVCWQFGKGKYWCMHIHKHTHPKSNQQIFKNMSVGRLGKVSTDACTCTNTHTQKVINKYLNTQIPNWISCMTVRTLHAVLYIHNMVWQVHAAKVEMCGCLPWLQFMNTCSVCHVHDVLMMPLTYWFRTICRKMMCC